MATAQQELEAVIAKLEAQRAVLGDAVVDAALLPLRARLAELSPTPPATQTLRQVSVLFLDVVGFTALAQHLDPEEIHAVMDGAMARCTAIVSAHQGKVLQYAGDSLLAVFGADEAQEDDAERAVHCGLALLQEGKRLGDEVLRGHGYSGFDVRVGVHTGSVLLGGGVDAQGSIRGISVNNAARMEQSAPAGALRISHDTYQHVRGMFDVEPQAPIALKGLEQPAVTYLVRRARPRAFRGATRGIEGVPTRMVGRDRELAQLQEAFVRLHRDGRLISITIVAEAGLGKSRLLQEFERWVEARAEPLVVLRARAHPPTRNHPYALLRDLLAGRLQIDDSDSMAAAKARFEAGVVRLLRADAGDAMAQAQAHLLGHLIGLEFAASPHVQGIKDDARQIRDRGFHAAAQMVRGLAVAPGTPVLLLLDDLHWADEGSLDFLDHLVRTAGDVPLLLIALTRPELFERRAAWPLATDALRVELAPLDGHTSQQLAEELLQRLPEVPAALRELVIGQAEGNPYYMEELVKMLVDEGAITTSGAQWAVVADKLHAAHVPQTLTGVLQARLDGLQPHEKLALQEASVIGTVFWDQALAAIDTRAPEALPAVTRRELVVPQPQAHLEGVREYAFRHQLLHHVVYDTVLKRLRRVYHAKVAAWLAGRTGARAHDFLGVTAEHYEQAGDAAMAAEYYARAAEHAGARYAHESTLRYVARALAVADEHDLLARWRLLDRRERALELLGRRDEQRADLAALQTLADALDDDSRRGEVAWRRCDFAFRTGDRPAMEPAARQAIALAERAGNTELRLRAQLRLAFALCVSGDPAAGEALAQEGLDAARAHGLRRLEGGLLNVLAIAAAIRNDMVRMLAMAELELPIQYELGNRRGETIALGNLGAAWLGLGENARARQRLEQALQVARAIGDRTSQPVPLINLAHLAQREQDAASARAHAQSALDLAAALHDLRGQAFALVGIGEAELALGRPEQAAASFERADALAMSSQGLLQRHDALAGLARAALARGNASGALSAIESLLAVLAGGREPQDTEHPALIRLSCYRVLAGVGDARAAGVLATAYAELRSRAAAIGDAALRASFLDIPEHREIVALFGAAGGSTANPA